MVALEREAILLVERLYMLSSKVENTKVIMALRGSVSALMRSATYRRISPLPILA